MNVTPNTGFIVKGFLFPGYLITLTWTSHGRKKALVGVQTIAEGLILSYKVNGESICDQVPIVHTPSLAELVWKQFKFPCL
jgi:hypothetical protein